VRIDKCGAHKRAIGVDNLFGCKILLDVRSRSDSDDTTVAYRKRAIPDHFKLAHGWTRNACVWPGAGQHFAGTSNNKLDLAHVLTSILTQSISIWWKSLPLDGNHGVMNQQESSVVGREDAGERSSVRAVERALQVLACFSDGRAKVTLSEAARLTGLPISTVSRLLATLESGGFLRRSGSTYACGTRLIQIGLNALQNLSAYEVAEAHLTRLTEMTGESSYLGVPGDDGYVVYVRQSLSSKSIRHSAWLGRTVPVKGTAIGAAITGIVGEFGFTATRQTLEPDVTAIAAPIHGSDGSIVAAVNLTGPTYRIADDDVHRFGIAVAVAARAISEEIGGSC
jgi:urocanate hydratase